MNFHLPIVENPSFADAIRMIEAADLPKQKIAAWTCALRRIADALESAPEGLVARWQVVGSRVRKLHPARAVIGARTLANHKSNVKAALRYISGKKGIPGRGAPLTPEFAALCGLVTGEGARYNLSAMMRYASALGMRADAIDDAFVAAYMDYRRDILGQDARPAVHRLMAKAWNGCAAKYPSWPQHRLTPPARRDRGVVAWESFNSSLRDEIDAWRLGMTKSRRDAGGGRRKPAKASTLRTRFAEIQAFARRAVALGEPIDMLDSLSSLLNPDLVGKVVDDMCGGGPPKTYVINLVWRLCALAEATKCLDPDAFLHLKEIRDALEDDRPTGMTEKNLKVVRAVMTGPIWNEIVALPAKLIEQALDDRKTAPVRAAILAQRAIGVAILTFMPVRIGNLTNIRIGTHLIRPNGPAGDYLLTIAGNEVKNGVDLQCPFDAELSSLIDIYIRDFRPYLMTGENHDFLFPGRFGSARNVSGFGERIAGTVEKAVGVRITAHQFRHAAAAIVLRNDPGNYEFARRILGHKSTKTTRDFYIALDGIETARRFGDILRGECA